MLPLFLYKEHVCVFVCGGGWEEVIIKLLSAEAEAFSWLSLAKVLFYCQIFYVMNISMWSGLKEVYIYGQINNSLQSSFSMHISINIKN